MGPALIIGRRKQCPYCNSILEISLAGKKRRKIALYLYAPLFIRFCLHPNLVDPVPPLEFIPGMMLTALITFLLFTITYDVVE